MICLPVAHSGRRDWCLCALSALLFLLVPTLNKEGNIWSLRKGKKSPRLTSADAVGVGSRNWFYFFRTVSLLLLSSFFPFYFSLIWPTENRDGNDRCRWKFYGWYYFRGQINWLKESLLALKAAGEILIPLKSTAKLPWASGWPKFHPEYLLMNLCHLALCLTCRIAPCITFSSVLFRCGISTSRHKDFSPSPGNSCTD